MESRVASIQLFLDSVLELKKVKRSGWISKVGIKNAESVADHTFSMCCAAMILSDLAGLDTERVMRMVILHDLAEAHTGDYLPGQINLRDKRALEEKTMKKILSKIPANVRREYISIWHEYVEGKTKTAKFVHRVDKLEMAMQAGAYLREGYSINDLRQFFESAESAVGKEKDLVTLALRSLRARG